MRAAWPQHKPMSVRISATDWQSGGVTGEESVEIARMFRKNRLRPDRRLHRADHGEFRPVYGRMFQTPFSDQIRNDGGIATMCVGAVTTADQVNTIIAAGRADLVALARPHLVDPSFTMQAAGWYGAADIHCPPQYLAGQRTNSCATAAATAKNSPSSSARRGRARTPIAGNARRSSFARHGGRGRMAVKAGRTATGSRHAGRLQDQPQSVHHPSRDRGHVRRGGHDALDRHRGRHGDPRRAAMRSTPRPPPLSRCRWSSRISTGRAATCRCCSMRCRAAAPRCCAGRGRRRPAPPSRITAPRGSTWCPAPGSWPPACPACSTPGCCCCATTAP